MLRPVGIWICTVWSAVFAGIFPLALMLFFYFGPARGSDIISIPRLFLGIALAISVIVFAIGTWRPVKKARWFLAAAVTIHYMLLAYQNYDLSIAEALPLSHTAAFYLERSIRSVVTAFVIAGYLVFSTSSRRFEAE